MTRVLQICNYYYPHIGGIEQVARDISGALGDLANVEQKILCFNEDAQDGGLRCERKVTTSEIIDSTEVIRCSCVTKQASQSISFSFPGKLKEVMEGFKPEIVIFHYPNPYQAFFLSRYLKKGSFRFVLYWHLDITKQKTLRKLFHGQTLSLLKRADVIVATSPVYIDGSPYLSRFSDKCVSIPNCISMDRLQVTEEIEDRVREIKAENEGRIVCFGVGRHIPYKGFKYLVEASKLLDDRFRIFIGGKGPLTDELQDAARGDGKVTFLGRVTDEELIAYYLAMDVFCFPSITKNEAFGIALAEGMYFGKPAVTFTIPGSGVNYVNLGDVTGLEVPNRDVRAYAEALVRLAENPELRIKLGEAAKDRVQKLFMPQQFDANIKTLVSELETW